MELFTFKAAVEIFGIQAQDIYRVLDDARITPVPLLPPCHMGLIYYRGELFDVIHLGDLVGRGKMHCKEEGWIILIKWSDKKLALVADEVIGVLRVEDHGSKGPFYTWGNYTIRPLTPDYLWNKLCELSYGPQKISKNLHPGIGEVS